MFVQLSNIPGKLHDFLPLIRVHHVTHVHHDCTFWRRIQQISAFPVWPSLGKPSCGSKLMLQNASKKRLSVPTAVGPMWIVLTLSSYSGFISRPIFVLGLCSGKWESLHSYYLRMLTSGNFPDWMVLAVIDCEYYTPILPPLDYAKKWPMLMPWFCQDMLLLRVTALYSNSEYPPFPIEWDALSIT